MEYKKRNPETIFFENENKRWEDCGKAIKKDLKEATGAKSSLNVPQETKIHVSTE